MKRILFGALGALALSTATGSAQTHSAEAVASAILTAFQQRDVATIGAHSSAYNADFFASVISGEQDSASVFNGTEGRAAMAWDGLILPARYRPDGNAVIPFAREVGEGAVSLEVQLDARLIAVVLTLDGPDDTSWGIDDLNFIEVNDYMALSESR